MKDLPFPVARFQSEGPKHINYYDSKFYHSKTTRHGGKDRLDPVLASFHHRWIKLYYSLQEYSSSVDERKSAAGQQFLLYCTRHRSAAVIQKVFKGHLVRKKFHDLGLRSYRTASEAVRNSILQIFSVQPPPCDKDLPLKGFDFVLSGNLTLVNGKALTHTSLKKNYCRSRRVCKRNCYIPNKVCFYQEIYVVSSKMQWRRNLLLLFSMQYKQVSQLSRFSLFLIP